MFWSIEDLSSINLSPLTLCRPISGLIQIAVSWAIYSPILIVGSFNDRLSIGEYTQWYT
jgi:hypothetical protein